MKKVIQHLTAYFCLILITLWIIGFTIFCLYALSFKYAPQETAEAIVVLTGGNDRIATAFSLLRQKKDIPLLISGVNKAVKKEELLSELPPPLQKYITLGYMAENTKENAQEVNAWIQKQHVSSILLVTSFYHVPRSLLEIRNQNKFLKISVFPVFPKTFDDSVDWVRTRYAWQLILEYHKFLIVHTKYILERIF